MTSASLTGLNTVTWPYSRHIGRVVEVGDRSAWLDAGSRTFGLDWYDLNSRLLEKASFCQNYSDDVQCKILSVWEGED